MKTTIDKTGEEFELNRFPSFNVCLLYIGHLISQQYSLYSQYRNVTKLHVSGFLPAATELNQKLNSLSNFDAGNHKLDPDHYLGPRTGQRLQSGFGIWQTAKTVCFGVNQL